MVEITVDASELRSKANGEAIKELTEFLKEKLKMDIKPVGDEIRVVSEKLSKAYLRVILRRFLHQYELKEDFRIISKDKDTLMIKERKVRLPPEE